MWDINVRLSQSGFLPFVGYSASFSCNTINIDFASLWFQWRRHFPHKHTPLVSLLFVGCSCHFLRILQGIQLQTLHCCKWLIFHLPYKLQVQMRHGSPLKTALETVCSLIPCNQPTLKSVIKGFLSCLTLLWPHRLQLQVLFSEWPVDSQTYLLPWRRVSTADRSHQMWLSKIRTQCAPGQGLQLLNAWLSQKRRGSISLKLCFILTHKSLKSNSCQR